MAQSFVAELPSPRNQFVTNRGAKERSARFATSSAFHTGAIPRQTVDRVPATIAARMRALVVEDDDVLGRAITRALEEWGNEVVCCSTLADALVASRSAPDLAIIDVALPDGSGVTLARELARQRPAPLVIAMSGRASANEAFQLGALGVRGYLPKPLSFSDLVATIDSVLEAAPDLSPLLVASVGRRGFREVQEHVRRTMAEQALAVARGNRTEAARLLGVTRQAVQQLIRDLDIHDTEPKRS
jgi:two-component system, response regulator RegA